MFLLRFCKGSVANLFPAMVSGDFGGRRATL
jgi:hypothetical protein